MGRARAKHDSVSSIATASKSGSFDDTDFWVWSRASLGCLCVSVCHPGRPSGASSGHLLDSRGA